MGSPFLDFLVFFVLSANRRLGGDFLDQKSLQKAVSAITVPSHHLFYHKQTDLHILFAKNVFFLPWYADRLTKRPQFLFMPTNKNIGSTSYWCCK
jgi:hypothetical protein